MPPYGSKRIYLPARTLSALHALEQDWAARFARGEVDKAEFPISSLCQGIIEAEAEEIGWKGEK